MHFRVETGFLYTGHQQEIIQLIILRLTQASAVSTADFFLNIVRSRRQLL